jgi:hypothetical protein
MSLGNFQALKQRPAGKSKSAPVSGGTDRKAIPSYLNANFLREYWSEPREQLPRAIEGLNRASAKLQELAALVESMPADVSSMSDEELVTYYDTWKRANDIAGDVGELAEWS